MEEKIFDLMTKMYAEMQDMKTDITEVKGIQLRMEKNLTEKIEALFDAREVQIDVDEKVATNLQRVESKVDKLEWKVIRNHFSNKVLED